MIDHPDAHGSTPEHMYRPEYRALKLICLLAATIVVLITARTNLEMNKCIENRKIPAIRFSFQRTGMNIQDLAQRSEYECCSTCKASLIQ